MDYNIKCDGVNYICSGQAIVFLRILHRDGHDFTLFALCNKCFKGYTWDHMDKISIKEYSMLYVMSA